MEFFNSAVGVLQTLVIALGAGLGIWGAINLLEGYGNDNPGANVQSFVKKYQEAYGATPDQFAADAYDAIYAIKAAVEKAGSTSGAALASALTSLTVEGVTGTMTWGSDGNTNKPASAILYYDGVGTLFDSQD